MNLILVEPRFPIPDKSRNHSHFLPIGLLKIGSWHKKQGDKVRLVRGLQRHPRLRPDRVLITSLFTYWSEHVHEAASFYRQTYPESEIEIGGIYASLMPKHCKARSPFAKVTPGLYQNGVAEDVPVDYSLLPEGLDYQIVHTTRGCVRRCAFCGTWRIEPEFTYKRTIIPEIQKPRLIFYDNNILANPYIDQILHEMSEFRWRDGQRITWECQSGLDLQLLTPERVAFLRSSRMRYPRIAWDGAYETWPRVRDCVRMLKAVGYGRKDIFAFMLYNHDLPYWEMRKKLDACRRWNLRVIDCRFRPLDSTEDGYRPGPAAQEPGSYYIHPEWTDDQVRKFRRAVRWQNIAILLDLPRGRYIRGCEQRRVDLRRS